ncbi:MAG: molybdopterin dehydrogenase [Planctomycetes bacterium]|nr:molybdopterin dehydrogenase [Planctomycetota bacterium]
MTYAYTLKVNGRHAPIQADPMRRLLDVLREDLGLTGAKEGCGEGECGACAVLLDGEPVCSCLVPVTQAEGRAITTVEGLAEDKDLDPLQEAFVTEGGVQCGACTPGILVTARAFLDNTRDHGRPLRRDPDRDHIREALAGNLCRCTGYEPILRSIIATPARPPEECERAAVVLPPVQPLPLADAITRLVNGATPIAGCTDLMVQGIDPGAPIVDLLTIPELSGIECGDDVIDIGAATTFTEFREHPAAGALLALDDAAAMVGGWQIQTRATIGGNIATASPAGDSLPALLALDAELVLHGPDGPRTIPYAEMHTGYRQTALRPGELIVRIRVPHPPPGTFHCFRKVGTRAAQAISKVVVAMVARPEGRRLTHVRIAAGSVADRPIRLRATEALLEGQGPGGAHPEAAGAAARAEVSPIDDVRSTREYRSWVLGRVVSWMVRSFWMSRTFRSG